MTDRVALVVDDEPANLNFLERLIEQAKFNVRPATSGKAALESVEGLEELALVLVDMKLPDMNGLQLTSELRKRFPSAYIIVATMFDERELMEKAFGRGCNVFLVKPHGFMDLFRRLLSTTMEDLCSEGHTVIDQYGPRQFTSSKTETSTQTATVVAAAVPETSELTAPAPESA
jgi:CheY-like chemotaxis protein